jgi:hypothetical protein
MAYRKKVTFMPPDVTKATTLQEALTILQNFVNDLCQKLNTELQNIERGG